MQANELILTELWAQMHLTCFRIHNLSPTKPAEISEQAFTSFLFPSLISSKAELFTRLHNTALHQPPACLSLSSLCSSHYHNKALCSVITYALSSWQWQPCCWPIVLSKHTNEWQKLSADLIIWPTKFPGPQSFTVVTSLHQTDPQSPSLHAVPPALLRLLYDHPLLGCCVRCGRSTRMRVWSLLMRAVRSGALLVATAIQPKDFQHPVRHQCC